MPQTLQVIKNLITVDQVGDSLPYIKFIFNLLWELNQEGTRILIHHQTDIVIRNTSKSTIAGHNSTDTSAFDCKSGRKFAPRPRYITSVDVGHKVI